MIFVTVGSQKFQFNRLLKEIDRLIEEKKIEEEVFAQIGYSDYTPQNYKYKNFLDRDEFKVIMDKSDKVITHGGTGAIVGAVKQGKKVIAVPRLAEYKEHVDDHQKQIVKQFNDMKLICGISDVLQLREAIVKVQSEEYFKYNSNTDTIIDSIVDFIESV